MQLSPAGERALKLREGPGGKPVLLGYLDDSGHPTAGYGHTGDDVKAGVTYTEDQCDAWFTKDSAWVNDCIAKSVKVPLTQGQYDALFSFIYNVGSGAFEKSTLLKRLNAGEYSAVPSEMLRWVISGGQKDPGLVNRRNSEGGQWVQGAFVRGSKIDIETPPPVWRQIVSTLHLKLKAAGTAIAGLGIGGAQLKDAGTQLQGYATMWHGLATLGIVLCVVGIAFEFFHKADG